MSAPTLIEVATRRSTAGRGRGKSQKSLDLVGFAKDVLAELHPATVRTVCYKTFVAGLTPDMSKKSTQRISEQLLWAREQGLIPWSWIVDETRRAERASQWDSPADLFDAAAAQYRRDNWREQPNRVEVWSEKGTIRGILAPVLKEYGVALQVVHGFAGASTMWDAARSSDGNDKPFTILYVGDYDPSGMCMSEVDIPKRLAKYAGTATIRRIALTAADVTELNEDKKTTKLPSFNADSKQGDSRYRWYVDRYGSKCWELDAMSPVDLRQRVESAIIGLLDMDAWKRALMIERAEKEAVNKYVAGWQWSISGLGEKYSSAEATA